MRTTFRLDKEVPTTVAANAPPINVPSASGGHVDASCNETITITCLQELYNAVGYVPSATIGNKIGITGYLDQFANIQDLQSFFAKQRPDALGSNFTFISINGMRYRVSFNLSLNNYLGGLNNQTPADAGAEANLGMCTIAPPSAEAQIATMQTLNSPLA